MILGECFLLISYFGGGVCVWLCHTRWCSGGYSWFCAQGPSWWCLGHHLSCYGSNQNWLCVKQGTQLIFYHSVSQESVFFEVIFIFIVIFWGPINFYVEPSQHIFIKMRSKESNKVRHHFIKQLWHCFNFSNTIQDIVKHKKNSQSK